MKKKVFVKPNPKWPLGVRDPHTREFIKPEGEWKPRDNYWLRRLIMKDVVEATPPKAAPKKEQKGED